MAGAAASMLLEVDVQLAGQQQGSTKVQQELYKAAVPSKRGCREWHSNGLELWTVHAEDCTRSRVGF